MNEEQPERRSDRCVDDLRLMRDQGRHHAGPRRTADRSLAKSRVEPRRYRAKFVKNRDL